MRDPLHVLTILAAAIAVFSITFILNPPAPRYYPLEHAWHFTEASPSPAMGWYGRSGAALLAGAMAGAITGAIARRAGKTPRNEPAARALALVLTLVIAVSLAATLGAIVNEQLPWFHKVPETPKIDYEY